MPSAPFWDISLFPSDAVLFVLGTDTGVGKTRVVEELIKTAPEPDRLHVIKAVQTGDDGDERDLNRYLKAGAFSSQVSEGYSFSRPIDPMTAASLEGRTIDPEHLIGRITQVQSQGCRVIVEGSGGVLSPFFSDGTGILSLISLLRSPVSLFLVSHPHLGTLSVTLSSVRIIRDEELPLKALILCDRPGIHDVATQFNPTTLQRLLNPLPVISLF